MKKKIRQIAPKDVQWKYCNDFRRKQTSLGKYFFAMYYFNECGDRERAKKIEIYVEKNNLLAA